MSAPSLETLPIEVFLYFLKFVPFPDQKKMRRTSTTIKRMVDQQSGPNPFHNLTVNYTTADRLCEFSRDIEVVKDLQLNCVKRRCQTDDLLRSIQAVLEGHQELKVLGLQIWAHDMTLSDMMAFLKSVGQKLIRLHVIDHLKVQHTNQPCDLVSLPHIKELTLQGESITDDELAKLVNATEGGLEKLEMINTSVNCENAEIACGKLKHLSIRGCKNLVDEGLTRLVNATGGALVELSLSASFGSDVSAERVNFTTGKLEHLKMLNIKNMPITDEGLTQLLDATDGITELKLGFTKVTGERVNFKDRKLQHLTALDVDNCLMTDEGLTRMVNATEGSLLKLVLKATSASAERVNFTNSKALAKLKKLIIVSNQMTDEGLTTLVQATGGDLTELILVDTKVSGERLDFNDGKLQRLRVLDMSLCDRLTDAGLVNILTTFSGALSELNIRHTNITRKCFECIPGKKLTELKVLDVRACKNLSQSDLEFIKSVAKKVKIIS